jgi:hypothetical protein
MKVTYESSAFYIVTFGRETGRDVARLVNLETKEVGPLVPVASIAAHCPLEHFTPFSGSSKDSARVLALVREKGGPMPTVDGDE